MVRQRLWGLWCCLAALPAGAGCLTVYSKNEVVRGSEPRIPVQFETIKAAQLFEDHVCHQERCVDQTALCIPFVTVYACKKELSKNARFNDAVQTCDRDRNGLLTEQEVLHYCGMCVVGDEPPVWPLPTAPAVISPEPLPPGNP